MDKIKVSLNTKQLSESEGDEDWPWPDRPDTDQGYLDMAAKALRAAFPGAHVTVDETAGFERIVVEPNDGHGDREAVEDVLNKLFGVQRHQPPTPTHAGKGGEAGEERRAGNPPAH